MIVPEGKLQQHFKVEHTHSFFLKKTSWKECTLLQNGLEGQQNDDSDSRHVPPTFSLGR